MSKKKSHILFTRHFPPEEFAARRQRVFDEIGDGAIAVLQAAPPPRGFQPYRQLTDFFYLSGIEVPQAILVLDATERKTTLYLPPTDPATERSEGPGQATIGPDALRELSGIEEIKAAEALADDIRKAKTIYVVLGPSETWSSSRWGERHADRLVAADPWDGSTSRTGRFLDRLRVHNPGAEFRDLTPILNAMRLVKSERELELLRRAGRLSALALTEAMRSTRPGVKEYELAAIAAYVFRVHGAFGEGYRPIVASGPNAWHGHYHRNDCALEDGELILMDCAPDYSYYTSDIGRMWPVNGTYSPVQRELYGFVVEYHKVLLARLGPGKTSDEVLAEAAEEMRTALQGWSFSKDIYRQAAERMLEFKGHLSHPVGMSVHDVGNYRAEPLRPGIVFTVDPQMWIPEEETYIRCEDTIAITPDGIENLTCAAPLELDEVEKVVGTGGMLQAYPPEFGLP